MFDDSSQNEFPPDIQAVADALRDSRPVPDGHLLERVLHRLQGSSVPHRRPAGLIRRLALVGTLAIACLVGANLTHVNVFHGVATLAGNLTNGSSTSSNGSAAGAVYCTTNCAAPLTPGYWKNHGTATTKNLPQTLGTYSVTTFSQAQAVFNAMNCGNTTMSTQNAFGCLAGQLLAAKLNVKNGAATPSCVTTAISNADALLISGHYVGPTGTYTLTSTQRSQAIALANTLNTYNNTGNC